MSILEAKLIFLRFCSYAWLPRHHLSSSVLNCARHDRSPVADCAFPFLRSRRATVPDASFLSLPSRSQFFYPIAAKGAWSTLVGNVTLIQGSDKSSKLFNPLASTYDPPSDFASQLSDPTKPIYLDANAANRLASLNANPGIPSFAHAVGLREQDLFGTSAAIFLYATRRLLMPPSATSDLSYCLLLSQHDLRWRHLPLAPRLAHPRPRRHGVERET